MFANREEVKKKLLEREAVKQEYLSRNTRCLYLEDRQVLCHDTPTEVVELRVSDDNKTFKSVVCEHHSLRLSMLYERDIINLINHKVLLGEWIDTI